MEVLNIEIEEKTDYSLSITYRDDMTNLPVDITSYSAMLEVKPAFGSDTVLLQLTPGNGLTLGGVTGNIDINIAASVTDRFNYPIWEKGAYSLVLIDSFSKYIPLLKGFVTIIRR